MSESLKHLRKMKRRLTMVQPGFSGDMSTGEKVDLLESTMNVFRAEVDMKLKIMQQILTTRNEQVAVQKKLLEREQSLYETLLGHWKNTPNLAASGISVNFSAADIVGDFEDVENQSDPDYVLGGDEDGRGPRRKKPAKSSLRRQRKSAKSTPYKNVKPKEDGSGFSGEGDATNNDQEGDGEFIDPSLHMQMKTDVDEDDEQDDENGLDEFLGDDSGMATSYDKYVSTLRGKITYKLSSRGYTYSKRSTVNGNEYYVCDQRQICGASLVHKDGRWKQGSKYWTKNGVHEAHAPNFERTMAQFEKSRRFLTKKSKKHRRHPERSIAPEILEQALEEMDLQALDSKGPLSSSLDTSSMRNKSGLPLPTATDEVLTCDLHPSTCPEYNPTPSREYCRGEIPNWSGVGSSKLDG